MRAFFVTFVDLFFIDRVEVFIFYNRFFYMGNFSRVYMLNDFLARFCFYYFPGWALDDFYIAVMASLLFRSPAFSAFMGHLKSSL